MTAPPASLRALSRSRSITPAASIDAAPKPPTSTPRSSYSPGGPPRGSMRIPARVCLGLGEGHEDRVSGIPVLVRPRPRPVVAGGLGVTGMVSQGPIAGPSKYVLHGIYSRIADGELRLISPSRPGPQERQRAETRLVNHSSPTTPTTRPRSPSSASAVPSGRESPFHHRERSLSISRPGSPLRQGGEVLDHESSRLYHHHTGPAFSPPKRMSLSTKRSVTSPYVPRTSLQEVPSVPRRCLSHRSTLSQASSPDIPSSFPKHLAPPRRSSNHSDNPDASIRKRSHSSSPRGQIHDTLPCDMIRGHIHTTLSHEHHGGTAEGSLRGLLSRDNPFLAQRGKSVRPQPRRVLSARELMTEDVDGGQIFRWLEETERDAAEAKTAAVRRLEILVSSDSETRTGRLAHAKGAYATLRRSSTTMIPKQTTRASSGCQSSSDDITVLSLASPSPRLSHSPATVQEQLRAPAFGRSVTAPLISNHGIANEHGDRRPPLDQGRARFRHSSSAVPLAPLTTLVVQQASISTPGTPLCETPSSPTLSRSESPSTTFDARRAGYALRLKPGYVSFGDVGLACPQDMDVENQLTSEPVAEPISEEINRSLGVEGSAARARKKGKWWNWTVARASSVPL